jgi:hypothetical protein
MLADSFRFQKPTNAKPETVRGDASALVSSRFFFILYFLYHLILNMLSIGSALYSASRNLLSTVSRKSTRVTWLIIKRWEITQGSKQRFDFPCTSSNLRLAQWLKLFLPDVDDFWVYLFLPNSSRFLKSPLTQAAWTLTLIASLLRSLTNISQHYSTRLGNLLLCFYVYVYVAASCI